ncbi:hypothetical protein NPIL_354331 [Nephila pilipes]|uniref:Uncharacterized protein n=1 Tax=Nephila pilipes TaxID=299642 RepID=A0A8X6TJ97_NEPPI|nr:hypothetical protein NPIL_354331 [Nephila pilipes]
MKFMGTKGFKEGCAPSQPESVRTHGFSAYGLRGSDSKNHSQMRLGSRKSGSVDGTGQRASKTEPVQEALGVALTAWFPWEMVETRENGFYDAGFSSQVQDMLQHVSHGMSVKG